MSGRYSGSVVHSYSINEVENPKRKYTKTEMSFLITMGVFLAILVGGVIAIIVVTTTHTTPVGGSVASVTPAPQPEHPKFV